MPRTARKQTEKEEAGVTIAGIDLSSPDKVLWPGQGVTKQDLAEHWVRVAGLALPHIANRPLTLMRCPRGRQSFCFIQKHARAGLHPAVATMEVRERNGAAQPYPMATDVAGLVALAQIGVLEVHLFGAAAPDLEQPDRLVLDLDPGEDVAWAEVADAARLMRGRMQAAGLEPFLMWTGGKGLHVTAPLAPGADWDRARALSEGLARSLEAEQPDRFTATASKAGRKGRIYVDWLRNGFGATAVAPYSPRAREGAPVALPMAWDDLRDRKPTVGVATLPDHLKSRGSDPWAGWKNAARKLS
ncbi:non-homologous end-joining DNA ligase [Indioceanicola profundi]|uniref:non-homologous end-joining DNA ligase n=1 Tax=Indioceanicola profundi TaxID=2220096 RepID=UPI000E6ABC9B|nr:non-homologous end-joining DNA ligase [Indioceanicola profundi]